MDTNFCSESNIPLFYAEILHFLEINPFDYISQYGLNNER